MPLSYQGILDKLDLDTQTAVSSAYLELCRIAEAQNLSSEKYERVRTDIARCLLSLAENGERDRDILKARAATHLPPR